MTIAQEQSEVGDKSVPGPVFGAIQAQHSTARIYNHDLVISDFIRREHPEHHLSTASNSNLDLDGFAKAGLAEMTIRKEYGYVADRWYNVPAMRALQEQGTMEDIRSYARIDYFFNGTNYVIYHVVWKDGSNIVDKVFVLSRIDEQAMVDGCSPLNDKLLKALQLWKQDSHDEIYVFDAGVWTKNKQLYKAIQKSSWDDVVLDPSTKAGIIADVQSFFTNQSLYAEYNIPWKRGVIFHGPPGNGKTITIKALMNEIGSRTKDPIPALCVKSVDCNRGGEAAIRRVFDMARKTAPCILIFEDLDSLVTDKLRSYFLNAVDGIEANDGILMIGSTNHLGKLDPAITKRPSRFDRKFAFALPEYQQRLLYAKYWHEKLKSNLLVDFGLEAAVFLAKITQGFSFAYMKELLVNSLMMTVGESADQMETELYATLQSIDKLALQDGSIETSKMLTQLPVPASLQSNKFVQILHKQAAVLSREMDSAVDGGGTSE